MPITLRGLKIREIARRSLKYPGFDGIRTQASNRANWRDYQLSHDAIHLERGGVSPMFPYKSLKYIAYKKTTEKIKMIVQGAISDRVTSAEIVLDLLSNVGGCGGLK